MPGSYRDTQEISLLRNVLRAGQRLVKWNDAELPRHGLSTGEFDVVMTLGNTAGLRMCDVAQAMLTSAPNVTRLVKLLIEKGLVERTRNPSSEREVIVRLTEKGERLFSTAYPEAYLFWKERFATLYTPQELATLNSLLHRLANPPEENPT